MFLKKVFNLKLVKYFEATNESIANEMRHVSNMYVVFRTHNSLDTRLTEQVTITLHVYLKSQTTHKIRDTNEIIPNAKASVIASGPPGA